jgi:hypothetical protein
MGKPGTCVYDVAELRRLWAAGKTHVEIAAALGCSVAYVADLRKRHSLPRRKPSQHGPQPVYPTPDEIRAMCETFKQQHLAELRSESYSASHGRAIRSNAEEQHTIRNYSWDGWSFNALS